MTTFSFANDYGEGAHERILAAFSRTNREQAAPYGEDAYSERAREKIKERLCGGDCDIHFLTGGTQTNLAFIAAALRPHQGVVAADTGHINVHETGAVEATGHKVLSVPSPDGKLTAEDVEKLCAAHFADGGDEHMVQPHMVYISHPSEVGTIYSKAELVALSDVCKKYGLLLYADGARLGTALTAPGTDVTLADLYALTDGFYIGGTKMGALCGEALVIKNPAVRADFRYIQKQRGAMPAKGRVIGIQFMELFSDGLYEELAAHANRQAALLRAGLAALGCDFLLPTVTNQIFVCLPRRSVAALSGRYALSWWQTFDETRDAYRLCTSWATPEEAVTGFLDALKTELKK